MRLVEVVAMRDVIRAVPQAALTSSGAFALVLAFVLVALAGAGPHGVGAAGLVAEPYRGHAARSSVMHW
jgi:hypothetical protein